MGKEWSWKGGAAARRDARATKGPEPTRPGAPGKKNTRRWCKGKEGREHKPKCMPHPRFLAGSAGQNLYEGWFDLVCTECGKVLDRYWPMTFRRDRVPPPPPEWVK